MDDCPAELQACSTEGHNSIVLDELQSSNKDDTLILCPEIESPHSTIDASSNSSNDGKSSSESKDLVREVLTDNHGPLKSYSERTCDLGSSSSAERQSPQAAVFEADNSKNKGSSQIFPEESSSSTSHQEPEDSCVDRVLPAVYPPNDVLGVQSSETSSFPSFSNSSSLLTPQPRSEETAQETNAGFLMLDSGREGSGNVLHVDVVSISSGSLFSGTREVSNREVRRNSRRLFWDAFSRRGSRRHTDSRTIFFSSEGADDLEFQDRWLLDFSGDLFEDSVGSDSGYLGSRSHGMYEGRWHSRSEIWDRFRGGRDESSQQTAFCASGLHPDGTCSCESFLTAEESGTRGSISRIVMLAEALFEVLDEIHRQPSSLPLSMVSVPAPESIVSRFPLKSHKKPCTTECGDDAEQCYICLSEYEDGDKVRVLPCHHEYHMSCVDKWLTEIHGVCPLCRRDVCLGASNGSISNSG